MRQRAFLAAAFVLAAVGGARASTPPGAWTTFMRAVEFTALLADSQQVWGATLEGGLVRWDRTTQGLEILRRQPGSVASNRLTALASDRSGRLWVGTEGSGVSRRSADGRRWDLVNLLDGLPSDSVRVLEATGDTVWIGTTRGIALWNGQQVSGSLPDGITVSFDTTFSIPSVTGIALLGDSLWIATRRGIGLAHVSQKLQDWRPMNAGLLDTDVRALASDGVDLFAQAGPDLYRWRSDHWEIEVLPLVNRLMDAFGVVLAGRDTASSRWVRNAADTGWVTIPGAPPSSREADPEITLDAAGRFFAASGETLFVQPRDPGPWAAYPLPEGPPSNALVQVEAQGGKVYVTTSVDGVARYDGAWRNWPPVQCSGTGCDTTFYRPRFVNGLFADRSGRKWAGSWSQAIDVFRDDLTPPSFFHPLVVVDEQTRMRSLFATATQDTAGRIWLGMDTDQKGEIPAVGLELYDSSGVYVRNYDLTNSPMAGNLVHGLATTSNGRIWVGYDGAGMDYITLADDVATFHHLSKTSGQTVRGVASYQDSLWMLTTTQLWLFGASAVGGADPAKRINLFAGIPQLGFKPITVGLDGTVYVGTSEGVRVFRPGGAIDSFTVENSPIPTDEVRALSVDPTTGRLWMATPGGLAGFDPRYVTPPAPRLPSLHARVYPNPALLTGLGVQLRISGEAEAYAGAVYDVTGRKLWSFHGAANHGVVWDGRDQDHALVPPGIYFVRVSAQGRTAVARVILLR